MSARDEGLLDLLPGVDVGRAAGQQAAHTGTEAPAGRLERVEQRAGAPGWPVMRRSPHAPDRDGDGLARGQVCEAERDDAADRVVADRDAVERVGGLDRAAVVGDDDELDVLGERAQRRAEAPDVRLVERRVDLVEHAERHGPDLEHREQQRDRGQGALATGEHRQRLALLARRSRRDLHAGRREVVRLGQRELGLAPAEQLPEAPRRRHPRAPRRSGGTARS